MDEVGFEVQPRLEWHNLRPFAIARLPLDYARRLTELAMRCEPAVTGLSVAEGWLERAAENPTGSRYKSYNSFELHPEMGLLLRALRETYGFLRGQIGAPRVPVSVQSWYNVHRAGQRLHRHVHEARYIGSFCAYGEGSFTRYGPSAETDESDYALPNHDGQLLVTLGRNHYHEVSVWEDEAHPRVSYAFDIVGGGEEKVDGCYVRLEDDVLPDGPPARGAVTS
jgi:hypothetical protein